MKFLFSIIIPTYNGEKTIGKLLTVIKNLSKHYSMEVIVIDSESHDNTPKILASFKKKIKCFKLISIKQSQFNHGGTRNLGVKHARGKYICFFSQDSIPINGKFLEYFLEDFSLSKKVVAVFGKQLPKKTTPFFQALESLCVFKRLDEYVDEKGILIQSLDTPFTKYQANSKFIWYMLFDPFSCYKRSFLTEHPFPHASYGEDLLLGEKIIKMHYTKIYDSRCLATHSHDYSLLEYYRREKNDLRLRKRLVGFKNGTNVKCKIHTILASKDTILAKIFHVIELFMYYVIKAIIVLELQLFR